MSPEKEPPTDNSSFFIFIIILLVLFIVATAVSANDAQNISTECEVVDVTGECSYAE